MQNSNPAKLSDNTSSEDSGYLLSRKESKLRVDWKEA